MAPVMMLVAWFCALQTRSKSDLAVVSHAVMPYSSTGQILLVYCLLRITVSASRVVPADYFMRASRTFALSSTFSVCRLHVRRSSNVTRRLNSISGLPRIDFDKPVFYPTFRNVQSLLQPTVYSCKVSLFSTTGPDRLRIWLPGLNEAGL